MASIRVEIYCASTDQVIASIKVPSGSPACLTGVVDLPAGEHELYLRFTNIDGDYATFGATGLQAIVGQKVETAGCLHSDGGGGG